MKTLISRLAVTIAASAGLATAAIAFGDRESEMTFIDVRELADSAEAVEYAEFVGPLASRHGLELVEVYDVINVVGGATERERIFLFRGGDRDAFAALMADPDYSGNLMNQDRIHDPRWAQRFRLQPILAGQN